MWDDELVNFRPVRLIGFYNFLIAKFKGQWPPPIESHASSGPTGSIRGPFHKTEEGSA